MVASDVQLIRKLIRISVLTSNGLFLMMGVEVRSESVLLPWLDDCDVQLRKSCEVIASGDATLYTKMLPLSGVPSTVMSSSPLRPTILQLPVT